MSSKCSSVCKGCSSENVLTIYGQITTKGGTIVVYCTRCGDIIKGTLIYNLVYNKLFGTRPWEE